MNAYLISEAITQMTYAITSVFGTSLVLNSFEILYTSWQKASMQLEDEKWLRENCRDPIFYTNLKAYTSVCSRVETNARVGAFWMALHEVIENFRSAWNPYFAGWVVCVFIICLIFLSCIFGSKIHLRRNNVVRYFSNDCMP